MSLVLIPEAGIESAIALREAAAGEYDEVISLIRSALSVALGRRPDQWMDLRAFYRDRVVVRREGRLYSYTYTIDDSNQVQLGQPKEVVTDHKDVVQAVKEAVNSGAQVVLEALDEKGERWLVRVVKAGWSENNNFYTDKALREAAPLFNGTRVFVKSDKEHLKGEGKSFNNLIGRLTESVFVAGTSTDSGEIQSVFEVLQSAGTTAAKLREAYDRNMASGLFGFSIDAEAKISRGKKAGKSGRIVESMTKVNSLDLIVEASAGGELLQLLEAINPEEETEMALLKTMIVAIKEANKGVLPEGVDESNEQQVLEAYNKVQADGGAAAGKASADASGLSQEQVNQQVDARLKEATDLLNRRNAASVEIGASNLPGRAQTRLVQQFSNKDNFTIEEVKEAIKDERDYLAAGSKSGHVSGLGNASLIEAGEDRAEKVGVMLDNFFDPSKPLISIREAYIEITGDRGVTGLMRNCDTARLRESVGDVHLREAVNAATFGSILGDSITRAMLREYGTQDLWSDWRFLCDVVPVGDFRTQERTRMGGYGDLPDVAENGVYTDLATPNDEKVTYALSKRGGKETLSLEAIANDDVGLIQRIPVKLGVSAKRTLYKFVFGFIDSNAAIYDAVTLFHASHNNLNTAALSTTSYAANKLAMSQQQELDSNEPLGLVQRHLMVPGQLEEAAFDMFVRNTNNDETFVQSHKPMVHVIPHWTDANNWYASADKREIPLIELGFYNGQEEPEIFIQDNPSQGSLFSNDQILYKIRHIYNAAIGDYRGLQGNIVA